MKALHQTRALDPTAPMPFTFTMTEDAAAVIAGAVAPPAAAQGGRLPFMRAIAIALIAGLGLVGCGAPSANPKLVGTYVAANAESLVFLADTSVLYARVVDGQEQRVTIGYTRQVSGAPGQVEVFAPDSSPFIGTRFEVDTNFTKVTVRWNDLRPSKAVRQSHYERKTDG
jgi:hypothetical protein